ncbi:MAG: flagellar basal body-associated FliL family protein [Verrucomicrobia bacterium]|nr:flagellar basal body-associated FliL family protein [Verrucomicrobiota bacterium]
MPVERFAEDDAEAQPEDAQVTSAEDHNTAQRAGWLAKLLWVGGSGVALTGILLACFLLTGVLGRPKAGVSEGEGTLVLLDEQTVNLAEPGRRLEVRIVLEASSPEFAALLRRRTAQLADTAITVLGSKTPEQLDTELERNRLKRELADAVGQRVRSDEAHITSVYFTRFYYE